MPLGDTGECTLGPSDPEATVHVEDLQDHPLVLCGQGRLFASRRAPSLPFPSRIPSHRSMDSSTATGRFSARGWASHCASIRRVSSSPLQRQFRLFASITSRLASRSSTAGRLHRIRRHGGFLAGPVVRENTVEARRGRGPSSGRGRSWREEQARAPGRESTDVSPIGNRTWDCEPITCRGSEQSIAERNQEINRRKMERNRSGGPVKVTDPEAFNRLMKEMHEKAATRKREEEEREAERKRREGDAYRDPEQRKKDAEEAKKKYALDDGDAGSAGRKFDPHKDYFKLLGVDRCASQAEIKAAYKRLALQYHPDKQRNATPMQREAINERFKELIEAYDVLMDDTLRECYDKARDYIKRNPGATSAPLSEEEQRMRAKGIAEFARLRRQKGKIHKNAPTEKQVWVSMEKMHSGCTKTVEHSRRRVDEHGFEYDSVKHFHLVIRKGSRDGIKHDFESEGDETVDTLPGDLVFVLRTKPHSKFKRAGIKNLEIVGSPPLRGDVWAFEQVNTLNRKVLCCCTNVMETSLLQGGKGGNTEVLLPGEGCYDPVDPWGQPAGDLKVRIRYPPLPLHEMLRSTPLGLKPLMLLPSAQEEFPACVAASMLHAESLAWMEKRDMDGKCDSLLTGLHVCCNFSGKASPAAATVLCSTPWIQWTTVSLLPQRAECMDSGLLDEEFAASFQANAIMIDVEEDVQDIALENPWKKRTTGTESDCTRCSAEVLLMDLTKALHCSGLWQNIFLQLCMGAKFVGVGHGCSMAGALRSPLPLGQDWCILPHLIRIGGDAAGWGLLHAAVLHWGEDVKGLGATVGSLLEVDPYTGHAEFVVVPRPEMLLRTAEAVASEGSSGSFRWHDELEDEEDEGFPEKCTYHVVAESAAAA